MPAGVEHITGDRADVAPLRGRAWDAAIDTSGYEARARAGLGRARRVGRSVLVSSCNAYPDWPEAPVDEDSPTWQDGEGYGPRQGGRPSAPCYPKVPSCAPG